MITEYFSIIRAYLGIQYTLRKQISASWVARMSQNTKIQNAEVINKFF